MSLPRSLSKDFFLKLAESVRNANEKFFEEVHECQPPVKLLCLQQSCISDNKYLIETLDGSIPVEYKHTCLALVPPTPEGDRQLVGKVISFNQYKVTPTKVRYLVVLTRISVVPGDYRHLIGHLLPALVYHPNLAVSKENGVTSPVRPINPPESGPVRKQENTRTVKTISNPYDTPKVGKGKVDVPPTKIADLTLYTPKWSLKARVVTKTEIHKFNNQRGESQLFTVDLCDSSGEIRAVFFGESANKWHAFLEEGQVYLLSGGHLKPANKKFNNVKHTCELHLDENSRIQLFQNDDSIPSFCYSFTPLDQLQGVQNGEMVDVIAIVAKAMEPQVVQLKASGTSKIKREVLLTDSTNANIWLCAWGDKSNNFVANGPDSHPLVCIKGAKVGEWQGKRLELLGSSQVIVEPVIPEALKLRKWWNENAPTLKFEKEPKKTITHTFSQFSTLSEIQSATNQALQFKSIDSNGMMFTTRALIEILKDNTFSWPACPGCRKKMNRDGTSWLCSKCHNNTQPVHTYMLSMKIVDDSSHLWVTAMSEVGEAIMGTKAQNLFTLNENGTADQLGKTFENYFEQVKLSEFVFKVKATVENFMDETKIKYRIMKASPLENDLDYAIKERVENIKKMMS